MCSFNEDWHKNTNSFRRPALIQIKRNVLFVMVYLKFDTWVL